MKTLWRTYQYLRNKGFLGMNRRNADYIHRYNPRALFPLVDNKLKTKRLAQEAQIPVPELYHVLGSEHGIRHLPEYLEQHPNVVIKPARGSGGDGVLVLCGMLNGLYRRNSGRLMDIEEIDHHLSNILSGMYSLGGRQDKALMEYRVQFDPIFSDIIYQGVPDIRVIVLMGYPVMAMIRLPTRLSQGKANLHQGGVGAGILLKTGETTHAVLKNQSVALHPDTGYPIAGLTIPNWDSILTLSARCYELSGLGYIGVDIVLDHHLGPLMLELNARPGLSIQTANQAGLLPRLHRIESHLAHLHRSKIREAPEERIVFSRENF